MPTFGQVAFEYVQLQFNEINFDQVYKLENKDIKTSL